MNSLAISGEVDPKFRPIADAFEKNFTDGLDIGASFCLFQNGEKKVDIWGGHMDVAKTRRWEKDTLVNVWSTTKGIMAFCVARLADQGLLDLNEKVSHYWPEFGANGKANITVAQLFSHQAGLCGMSRKVSYDEFVDTDLMAELLAAEKPAWEPGTRSGYHALTIGPLADGLFQKVIGKRAGAYFRDEIAEPYGLDLNLGLPASEDYRVAELAHNGGSQAGGPDLWNEYQTLVYGNTPVQMPIAMRRDWRAQGTPSAGAQANARAVATLYSALATDRRLNGAEIISEAGLKAGTTIQIENEDLVLRFPIAWGVGFGINTSKGLFGPNAAAFGHSGWGGSFGFADPISGIGAAYTMNYMIDQLDAPDPRVVSLLTAIYSSLG
ncbi:MAG: serine hydrolase domain-containing protein [Pseudomonadota bacterium]